jgi:glutathione S-transferase
MALEHKQVPYKTIATHFAGISSIADGKQKTVPVIEDKGQIIADSWAIANYLEDNYEDRPSLFGGSAGHALSFFVQSWVADVLHSGIISLIILDIHSQLDAGDKEYFRTTREKRFGRTLEDVQKGRELRVAEVRKSLQPLRQLLATQHWLGGSAPLYADYLVFGALQWPRVVSQFAVLGEDDLVADCFARSLDLFGGLARSAVPTT